MVKPPDPALSRHFDGRGSIRRRLVLSFGSAALVLMLLAGYHVYVEQRDDLFDAGRERAVQLSNALAVSGTSWVIANDLVGLQELVNGLGSLPDLRRAYFLNPQGQVLASTQAAEVGFYVTDLSPADAAAGLRLEPRLLVEQPRLVVVERPVVAAGRQLGWVRVETTLASVAENLQHLQRSWLRSLVFIVASIGVVAWLLSRHITRGLRYLIEVAERVETGDDGARTGLQRDDEIGLLGRHMDRMLDALARQKELMRTTIDTVPDIIFVKNTEGAYLDCNKAMERLMKRPAAEIIGKTGFDLFDPTVARVVHEAEQRLMETGAPQSSEQWLDLPDAGRVLFEVVKTPFHGPGGQVLGLVGMARDITDRRHAEEAIRDLAFYDLLTGLPNRRLLTDRLAQALAASHRQDRRLAVMFLDLDNFKTLNDQHGHDAGDRLLVEVARRIRACLRETDTVARFGGDEFVVLVTELSSDAEQAREHATRVAEKIRTSLAEPYRLSVERAGQHLHLEHHCTASIGLVMCRGQHLSDAEVLKAADAAMYEAKEAGRNQIRMVSACT